MIPRTSAFLKQEIEKISKVICRYSEHNDLLRTYKKNNKFPKGLKLKFHVAVCPGDELLFREFDRILERASSHIQDSLIQGNNRHINEAERKLAKLKKELSNKISVNDFQHFQNSIQTETNKLKDDIKLRHQSKYTRDHINVNASPKKSRRFDKKERKAKFYLSRKEKRRRLQQRKALALQKTPNQDPINPSNHYFEKKTLICTHTWGCKLVHTQKRF